MGSFCSFANNLNLVEINLTGKCFTWKSGNSMRRIDKALGSCHWFQKFPQLSLIGLPKRPSDHKPIVFTAEEPNWGPKPIRFVDIWWSWPKFNKVVKGFWSEISQSHTSLAVKMKLPRHKLNDWNKNVFGHIDHTISTLRWSIDAWDNVAENRALSESELEIVQQLRSNLRSSSSRSECIWRQKSRIS
ncbi:uncharacterized protein LOC110632227 [Hevea brasiliensis]|uniref:uncharacterized protein LOC110632227 n=1 Tax=Hevea brasiliensis TaxID=3981 RepID=UPI0025DCF101|nr:uncharacterized protein LOC110632227 [Hevea brasiliensis]